jgi:SAM-dependent methyltransferase
MNAASGPVARFKAWREAFLDRHSSAEDWRNRYFSGATWSLFQAAVPLMAEGCRGLVLDAGSGRGGWRSIVLRSAERYESIDLAPRGAMRPDWVGDLSSMPQVPDARFDSIVCHQVLEHVPAPMAAMQEMARVLKPGGLAVISVPHLSRRHELPHDYYRFTPEGLVRILQAAGFVPRRVLSYGGIFCFLHHQIATLLLSPVSAVPILGTVLAALMAPFSVLAALADRLLDCAALAPLGVIVLAERAPPSDVAAVERRALP